MKEKIRIGITGASGLLGSYLAKRLYEEGYTLSLMRRSDFIPESLTDIDANWIKGDIREYGVLKDFIEPCDLIIHAAAVVSFKKKDIDHMMEVNVGGTRDVVNEMLGTGKRLIHISSVSTLSRRDGATDIDESCFWDENVPHSPYAKSKFLAEMEVQRGISEGLDAMIFLPSIILGRSERGQSSSNIWTQIKKFPYIAPQGGNGFVDVKDIAEFIVIALKNWKQGEKLILNGHNVRYLEFYNRVKSQIGINGKTYASKPAFLLFLMPFVKIFLLILGKSSVISKAAIETTSKSFSFDASKSVKVYNINYTSLDISVSRYLEE